MDRTQLAAFCDYAIGHRDIGAADNATVETPHAPELRAFVVARLGELTPRYGYQIVPWPGHHPRREWEDQARAFAGLLREVADGIDPPPAPDAA